MYSMVLLAALTTATDTPDWGRRGGCCGCYGGYGWGGWGGGYGGYGWGGWGGGYGGWGGGYGGWGGWGGWGGYAYAPVVSTYASPVMLASNSLPAAPMATRSMYSSPDTMANNRATIIVHVPDDATLIVDGRKTTSVSSTRRFYSPPLEPGKSYHYNFEAIVKRDGKTVKAEQRIEVRAGDTRNVSITMPDLDQNVEREHPATEPAETKGLPERRVNRDSR